LSKKQSATAHGNEMAQKIFSFAERFFGLKAILLFFFGMLSGTFSVFGQSNAYFPDLFSSYFQNLSSIQPSYVPEEGKADFYVGYKFRTDAFKDISTFSFSGARVFRNERDRAQVVRLTCHNEQQGPYINTPRAYLNYAFSLPLGEETSLSTGLALGAVGMYFSAPSATTSLLLPDASLGIGLQHKSTVLSLSSQQLFNQATSPMLATIRLARHYQVYAKVEKELGIDWKTSAHLLWRILPNTTHEANITALLHYADAVIFGCQYRYRLGMAFVGSFQIDTGKDKLLISITYNSPAFSQIPRLQNSLEVGLGYLLQ
jgi:hypothetical protein